MIPRSIILLQPSEAMLDGLSLSARKKQAVGQKAF